MKVQVKAYNMPVDEIQHFIDKGYDLCKCAHQITMTTHLNICIILILRWGKKLVITGTAYKRIIKALKEGDNHDIK